MESDFSHGLINGIEVLMNVTMTCFLSYPLIIERNSSVHGDASFFTASPAEHAMETVRTADLTKHSGTVISLQNTIGPNDYNKESHVTMTILSR